MKRLRKIILSLVLAVPLTFAMAAPVIAASDTATQACQGAGGTITEVKDANGKVTGTSCSNGSQPLDLPGAFKNVANVLIFIVGAISVIMVIIGGLRYVLSGGDAAGVKSAKDTVLYAIVGVVVAILAYSIVNFVISRF